MTLHRWSRETAPNIGQSSGVLDLDKEIFTRTDPAEIAATLKISAEKSRRRRTTPYRSAMSMLTFHINRAGGTLPDTQLAVLEAAKDELRKAFGRFETPIEASRKV